MKDWPTIVGGIAAACTVIGILWATIRTVLRAEDAIREVPMLRKELEAQKGAAAASLLQLRTELSAHIDNLQHDNEKRSERIQNQVESRFELLGQALGNINSQLGVIGNDVGWLKRLANGHGRHEEPR
jgi:uncharacterized protein YlxW (UPF0749 family)